MHAVFKIQEIQKSVLVKEPTFIFIYLFIILLEGELNSVSGN